MVEIGYMVNKDSEVVITDQYKKNASYESKRKREGRNSSYAKQESSIKPIRENVFIVHGRDNANFRYVVAQLLEQNGFKAIILDQKPDEGLTIIEKFEKYAAISKYAIVLLTPDDKGGLAEMHPLDLFPRARQNVFFELGYFYGILGRKKVCALYQGIEIPSDLAGILYISIDKGNEWKSRLLGELKVI